MSAQRSRGCIGQGAAHGDTDRAMAKAGGLCACDLDNQNARYAGTGGVSFNNRQAGFSPAYLNTDTGEMVVSCFADGSPAPVHVLDGLPGDWVAVRGDDGGVSSAVSSVVAGFTRHGVFYTRADAARLVSGGDVDAESMPSGPD